MTRLTISILGKRALGNTSAEDYVDWAGEMLIQGYDSHTLRILAGLDRRGSVFDTEGYFLRCLKELSIGVPETKDAVVAYACDIARQIVEKECTPKDGVRALYQVWLGTEYDPDYVIWHQLDDAQDSLLEDAFPYGYHSATLENFDDIVKQEAERFIADVRRQTSG